MITTNKKSTCNSQKKSGALILKKNNIKNSISLKTQLITLCTFTVSVPLLIVTIVSFITTSNVLTDKIKRSNTDTIYQMKLNANSIFSNSLDLCSSLSFEDDIAFYHPEVAGTRLDSTIHKKELGTYLDSIRISKGYSELFLLSPNGETLGTLINPSTLSLDFKKFYNDINLNIKRFGPILSGYGDDYSTIFITTRLKANGLLVCGIDINMFDNILGNDSTASTSETFLLNEQNIVIYSSNPENIGTEYISNDPKNLQGESSSFSDSNNLINYIELTNNYKLISKVPNSYIFKEINDSNLLILFILFVCLAISILVAIFFSEIIQKPILGVVTLMKSVENGDFRVKSNYSGSKEISILSTSFNVMTTNVSNLIREIQDSSNVIDKKVENVKLISNDSTVVSQQVSSAIQEIATTSTNQAKESEETLKHFNKLATSINTVSSSINIVSSSSDSNKKIGNSSLEKVFELEEKTNESTAEFIEISTKITNLTSSLKNIDTFLKIIDNISTQTKLLALNASIEAAHAGEYGSGFAIVANEVKNLSIKSTESTTEISKLINDIRSQTSDINTLINNSSTIFKAQKTAVDYTSNSFKEILSATNKITTEIDTVKTLVESMNSLKENSISAINFISSKAEEASTFTEEVMASTEEQSALSLNLSNLTNDLYQEVSSLRLSIEKFKV